MNNNIDPFEEFEFKPITEGLGFHREQKKLNTKKMDQTAEGISDDSPKNLFTSTLPKKNSQFLFETDASTNTLNRSTDVVDEILRNIQSSKNSNTLQNTVKSPIKTTKVEYKKSSVLLAAIFLDMMLVTASTLLCLVLLLAVTKVDLLANLKNPDEQGLVYLSTFALLVTVGFVYYLTYRVFLGATPGEWAYDQKIQPKSSDKDGLYAFKIILRSLIIIFTGIVFIPFFSWILKKDLVGELIGLHLLKK